MADVQTLFAKITDKLSQFIQKSELTRGEITIEVDQRHIHDVCLRLRDDPEFDFQMLMDVCGVDYLHYGVAEWETESATTSGFERGVDCAAMLQLNREQADKVYQEVVDPQPNPIVSQPGQEDMSDGHLPRFAAVYHLLSLRLNHRVRVRAFLHLHEPKIASVIDIWPSANWFEREAFDLFGIIFTGHPDLRRLLTDYGFIGHPFRKDFPLSGNVEVRYDAKARRVVYEPVSITPRILEPKVIRRDNRYQVGE